MCAMFGTKKLHRMFTNLICQIQGTLQGRWSSKIIKGVVLSYQIQLVLPSVAEMYPSGCNLQLDILRHNAGKVLRFQNNHSLLKVSSGAEHVLDHSREMVYFRWKWTLNNEMKMMQANLLNVTLACSDKQPKAHKVNILSVSQEHPQKVQHWNNLGSKQHS